METPQPNASDPTKSSRLIGENWVKISIPQAHRAINEIANRTGWVAVQPNWQNADQELVFGENKPDAKPIIVISLFQDCAWADPNHLPKHE